MSKTVAQPQLARSAVLRMALPELFVYSGIHAPASEESYDTGKLWTRMESFAG